MEREAWLKIIEEFLFWEKNYFNICINKQVPEQIPDNEEIFRLLNEFREEHDYYAIMLRRAMIKKIYKESFIESLN